MKIHIVLDNIRSVFNVGSIFRSADGAGYVEKIYLCGITADVDHPKLEKTALGATEMINSEHYDTTIDALEEIKGFNIPIYSVELTPEAKNFQKLEYSEDILKKYTEETIKVPMRGIKKSLNVANCATAVLYEITRELD